MEVPLVRLFDAETGAAVGSITDEQLQFLKDQLEEESEVDQDYYINQLTLEVFEEDGADPALLEVLRKALGGREEMELRWARS